MPEFLRNASQLTEVGRTSLKRVVRSPSLSRSVPVRINSSGMKKARTTQYGLLVIDGDHRYAGVKHDLESYLGTVAPGGYVILDDYGNPSWPDVKQYVDAEVMGRKDLECVGSDWHTAVFRVGSGSSLEG